MRAACIVASTFRMLPFADCLMAIAKDMVAWEMQVGDDSDFGKLQ